MGLSPGKKKAKAYDARVGTAISNVGTVNPLQAQIDAKTKKFLDWEASTTPKDITEAPGIDAHLDIYGNARRLADEERFGSGGVRLGSTADSAYSAQLDQQKDMEMYDDRAAGLSGALSGLKDEAYGHAGRSINADTNRKLALAQLTMQDRRDYYGRPKKQSIWDKILNIGAQAVGAYAGA